MLFHALKCNCTYNDVYLVTAVMPGVGMYVMGSPVHVCNGQPSAWAAQTKRPETPATGRNRENHHPPAHPVG